MSRTTIDHETLIELRSLLEKQIARIDQQAETIDAQGQELQRLRVELEASRAVALAASSEVATLKRHPFALPDVEIESRLEQVEQVVHQRVPEMPTELVSAGEFPGSIRVPGTDAAFKLGGQSRQTLVHTLRALGADDRFVTSSIPIATQQPGEDARIVYSPQASRVNLDLRTGTPIGSFRSFIEADFAGSGGTLRLRHAYGQGRRWLVGQTWSTFSDPEAEPIGIDFEGLNAISLFRQPQVRYTWAIQEQLRLAVALENPRPDLTDAQGVSVTPDFIARLRWEPKKPPTWRPFTRTAHVQAAILARQLRGELDDQPDTTLATGGFGGNVSGVLIPRWDTDDRLKFAANAGWGIGRYITDLSSLGGQDAVYDPTLNDLRALSVSAGYLGYERQWRPTFTSTVTYGIVNVQNLDIQHGDALRRTQRASINLTWTPIPQTDIVLELLAGRRVNKDGQRGTSSQIQTGWTFRF